MDCSAKGTVSSLYERRDAVPLRIEVLSGGFPSANNGNETALSSAASFATNNEDHLLSSASLSASLSGYGSHSFSSDPAPNKKRKRSLLRTVKHLVTKRRWKGGDVDDDGADSMAITPLNGNTPRISRSTPSAADGHRVCAAECIDEMVGADSSSDDFAASLFREESRRWPPLRRPMASPSKMWQGVLRRSVVDWLCSVGVRLELRRSTIYRAVFYLDAVCSTNLLCDLRVAAASSLLVAAKWNEAEERVPTLRDLCRATVHRECASAVSALRAMEVAVLDLLSFDLKVVLPLDFVRWAIGDDAKVLKFAIFFLDLAVLKYDSGQWPPSILAAAVLTASRRALGIAPFFSHRVAQRLRCGAHSVAPCFDALWLEYREKFPGDARSRRCTENLRNLKDSAHI